MGNNGEQTEDMARPRGAGAGLAAFGLSVNEVVDGMEAVRVSWVLLRFLVCPE